MGATVRQLRGLTTRGRCLLACGVSLDVFAVAFGQPDLLRVGIFLVALPLVAVALVSRTRYRLSCQRRIDPPRVPAGHAATVRLRLDNVSRLPSGVLLLEDSLPMSLGGRPRFALDRVEPGGVREVDYAVRSDVRGRYVIGPLSVRLTDPFGLVELTRSFVQTEDLVVTPVVSALPPVRLGGDWAGGTGESLSRALSASGADDATTREYRRGDDLRKVHWRSTARVGELMVRREEQILQSRATLLLDGRRCAHRGDGPGSSYEYAVCAAASIGIALQRAGFVVSLLNEEGEALSPPGTGTHQAVLLDALALVTPSSARHLHAATAALRASSDSVLIAVLGHLNAEDAERLARLRTSHGTCVAVLLDTPTWGAPTAATRSWGGAGGAPAAPTIGRRPEVLLTSAGWRVVPVTHGTTLASVWSHAGVRPGRVGVAP
ncbi:MAG: DUF58 domain-containing protein [Mycobacteriales bacterium]